MKAISATFPVTAKLSDFPFYNIEHRSDLVHHYHNHSQQNPTCMIIVCVQSIFVVQYTLELDPCLQFQELISEGQ